MHDESVLRAEVLGGPMEAGAHRGRGGQLYLDRRVRRAGAHEEEVYLVTAGRAVVVRPEIRIRRPDDAFDCEALEAGTHSWVPGQVVVCLDFEQGVEQAAVTDKDLGRLRESLACVAVPRSKPADQSKVDQQVHVPVHGGTAHAEAGSQSAGVEQPAAGVCEHRP